MPFLALLKNIEKIKRMNSQSFMIHSSNLIFREKMVDTISLAEKERKKTKKYAWLATVIYLLLFPFLLMLAGASILVFDSPSMPIPLGLSIIFVYFCVPFSIPVAVYLVWSRYSRGVYKESRQFCLMPLYFFVALFIYDTLAGVIRHLI